MVYFTSSMQGIQDTTNNSRNQGTFVISAIIPGARKITIAKIMIIRNFTSDIMSFNIVGLRARIRFNISYDFSDPSFGSFRPASLPCPIQIIVSVQYSLRHLVGFPMVATVTAYNQFSSFTLVRS